MHHISQQNFYGMIMKNEAKAGLLVVIEAITFMAVGWLCMFPHSLLGLFSIPYKFAPQIDIVLIQLCLILSSAQFFGVILASYIIGMLFDVATGSLYGISALSGMAMAYSHHFLQERSLVRSNLYLLIYSFCITMAAMLTKWLILCVIQVGIFSPFPMLYTALSTMITCYIMTRILGLRHGQTGHTKLTAYSY